MLKLVESKKYDHDSVKGALEPIAEQFGRRLGEAGAFGVIALACLSLKPQDMPESDKELSAQMIKNVEKFSEAFERIVAKKQDQIGVEQVVQEFWDARHLFSKGFMMMMCSLKTVFFHGRISGRKRLRMIRTPTKGFS